MVRNWETQAGALRAYPHSRPSDPLLVKHPRTTPPGVSFNHEREWTTDCAVIVVEEGLLAHTLVPKSSKQAHGIRNILVWEYCLIIAKSPSPRVETATERPGHVSNASDAEKEREM